MTFQWLPSLWGWVMFFVGSLFHSCRYPNMSKSTAFYHGFLFQCEQGLEMTSQQRIPAPWISEKKPGTGNDPHPCKLHVRFTGVSSKRDKVTPSDHLKSQGHEASEHWLQEKPLKFLTNPHQNYQIWSVDNIGIYIFISHYIPLYPTISYYIPV